ncbi:MAG: hypothetical protein JSV05_03995 [Candidatus Bathyarchaeota archaeon]|nr:MAG: hypothetical protein JSV05_03995 [Candidatus Bathyarchaeota archaeon]
MNLDCGACGKNFKWPRKVNFCARCQIIFMDWQIQKMDEEFDRLFGDLELSTVEEGSRKRKIKEEFTPIEWMKELFQSNKIDRQAYTHMVSRLEEEKRYRDESERLSLLMKSKEIDKTTFEKRRMELEQTHQERLGKLDNLRQD